MIEASREHHPDTPIMATTGYSGPEYGEEAKKRGADVVLRKPIDREQLFAEAFEVVRGDGPWIEERP